MHVFVGLVVGYAVMFGLMKLGASPKLGVPMFWITFLGTAFWSAVFSPWAKAEEKRNQQAAYEQWRKEEEAKRLAEEERKKREQEAEERRRKERERIRKEAQEKAARQTEETARRAEEAKRYEERFLRYLFSMLAKLAKADGQVDADEVKTAEKVFDRFEFALRRRQFCSNVFNTAKNNSRSIYWYAEQFGNQISDVEVCIFIYELLWDMACADGWLHPAEKDILRNICDFLHIPKTYFDVNYRRRNATFVEGDKKSEKHRTTGSSKRNWRRQYVSGKSSILEAYELLESESTATPEELKSAYRRVAKRYHPDLLRANGVPEEMITEATELMSQVNAAWDDIRRSRGFS